MHKSLVRQIDLLEDTGIAFHTLWKGSGEEIHHDLLFVYYSREELTRLIPEEFKVLQMSHYEEDEKDDSILLILQKE
jgi:hypothetical protein